ncbi:MAG TPA: extracellular solute-binding protein [Thermomicrobiales bacterium]|nr:extracellular solute-binding protein [Thermomicrobiales bacterium]
MTEREQQTPVARGLSRRQLLQRAGVAGAAFAATPLLMRSGPVSAQDDIPRAKSSAQVKDKLRVLIKKDFHPDHNEFMRSELQAYADVNGWDIEITDVAGYQGGGDLYQKLLGAVQAGSPPDLVIHEQGVENYHTLGVVQPVSDMVQELAGQYGEPTPGMQYDSKVGDDWYAVPFFTRANGLWVRQDMFADAGLDIINDTDTYDKLRDSTLKTSDPSQKRWGWGMTVNRSGDGNGLVQGVIFRYGGHVQDESGEVVTFNSPETIAALNWLKETYSDDKYKDMLPPGVLSWTDTNNNEAFLSGQTVATLNAGTLYAKAVFDKLPFADQIALIPSPKRISDGARLDFLSGGIKFFLITDAPNKEASFDLMRHFLTEPVKEKIWTISTGYALPAYTNEWENEIITKNENSMRAKDIALNDVGFTGLYWPGKSNAAIGSIEAGTYFTDMMSEILQGRSTEDVVKDYHEKFVQIYQDFGFKGE